MPRVRLQLALRWATAYLLMVAVCFGPASVLAMTLTAASNGCGGSCPCDEAKWDSSEPADGVQVAEHTDPGHDDCAPSDECPDDCPNCHCSMGASLAVLPLALAPTRLTSTSVQLLTPIAIRATGARLALFRPPRSVG